MKKNLLSMFALATMLLATGCSSDEEIVGVDSSNYVDASFTIDLNEGVQSRTLGLGAKVNQLYYGIFDQSGNVVPVITNVDNADGNFDTKNVGEASISGGTATVKMRLVKGQTYDFVFWAQVKNNAHYNINKENLSEITVNYNGDANDETRDAFFACEPDYKVESHFTKTVILKRPFAQVNVGTTKADFEAAKILLGENPITQSKMVVKNIPSTLNLLTGDVSNQTVATFNMAPLPKEKPEVASDYEILEVQETEYAHLAMNYFLSDIYGEQEVVELDVELANAKGSVNTFHVSQLPIHRNYRTNIIGNILTSNGEFEVIVDAAFEGEVNRELWDGESTEAVVAKDENGVSVYEVSNAKQLAWVAEQVSSGANSFKGAIVRLTADIYLDNQPWTPVGNSTNAFEGTFDGAGYTIHDLKIVAEKVSRALKEGDQEPAGLFARLLEGTIENFIVDGAYVSHVTGKGNGIGVVVGDIFGQGTVKNVTVKNAILNGNRMMGGIAGRAYGKIIDCAVENVKLTATPDNLTGKYDNGDKVGGIIGVCWNSTLSANKATNVTIMGYRELGGIVGAASKDNYATKVSNSVVNELDIIIDDSHNYKNYSTESDHNVGAIVGKKGTDYVDDDTNTSSDVEIIYSAAEVTLPVTNAEEFMAAIDADVTEITVAGEIDLTQVTFPATGDFTLVGVNENAVLNALSAASYYSCNGANITFKSLTIKLKGNNYGVTGLANFGGKHIYEDCKFEGVATVWGECVYNNCEFTATVDGQYAAFANSWYPVVYNDCKFTASNRAAKICPISRGVENGGASEEGDVTVEYNNCTFISSTPDYPAIVVTQNHADYVEVKITNATIANMGAPEKYYGNEYFGIEGENVVVTLDDAVYAKVNSGESLVNVLKENAKQIEAVVTENVDCNLTTGVGGDLTETVTISGIEGDAKVKLNITCKSASYNGSYCTYRTINPKAIMNFKNLILEKSDWCGKTWNTYNIEFYTDVNVEDCMIEHPITVQTNAVIKNTTIDSSADTSNTFYSVWMVPGSNSTLENCVIKGNRGIKIDEQYCENPTKSNLSVAATSFETTGSKAAIMVKSVAGADITLNNVSIEKVAADTEYAVWVDEDAAAYADKVRVVGGKVKIEGQIADGVTEKDGTYSISNANGMLWFANEVNVNKQNFSGKVVKLVADIDLKGIDWEPIGQTDNAYFKGTFDGGNYTISNLSVDSDKETTDSYSSGLFGWLQAAVVKNVKVNVATIVGHKYCGVIAGYMEWTGCTIEGCEVVNAEVSCTKANEDADGGHAGVIVGYARNTGNLVKACQAKDSSVSAARRGGQIAGSALETNVVDCTATNVKVVDNKTGKGDNINEDLIGLK